MNCTPLKPTEKQIVVVCNDPGGAKALLPVVQDLASRRGVAVLCVVAGVAARIIDAEQWGCDVRVVDDDMDQASAAEVLAASSAETMLTGAGTYNAIEHTFRVAAEALGIRSVSFVDYWNEWEARFQREMDGRVVVCRPDVVCAIDDVSRQELTADGGFEESQVVVTGSPTLEQSMKHLRVLRAGDAVELRRRYGIAEDEKVCVFFSDAFYTGPGGAYATGGGSRFDERGESRFGYTPDGMLSMLLEELGRATETYGVRVRLVVKPHPREHPEKLLEVLAAKPQARVRADITETAVSLELIAIADAVFGMGSIVMIESGLAGVPTFSVQIGLRDKEIYDPCPGNANGLTVPVVDVETLRVVVDGVVSGAVRSAWLPAVDAMAVEGAAHGVADVCDSANKMVV